MREIEWKELEIYNFIGRNGIEETIFAKNEADAIRFAIENDGMLFGMDGELITSPAIRESLKPSKDVQHKLETVLNDNLDTLRQVYRKKGIDDAIADAFVLGLYSANDMKGI